MNTIEANKEHIPIIRALSDKIWPPTFKDILSKEQIVYMMDMMYSQVSLEKQMDEGHRYLLAKEGDEYLGYISYELNYKNNNITKIHKIYVLPSLQGKGIGRFFINIIAEIAQINDNKELSLNVNRNNTAINFYKRMGFEFEKTENIDIGNGFVMEDYIMKKKI